jgi:Tfp pilus assembly protein PilF
MAISPSIRQGDLAGAIEAVRGAVKADPNMEDAYINLGQFLTRAGWFLCVHGSFEICTF